jgi:filamentous hemagglutinin
MKLNLVSHLLRGPCTQYAPRAPTNSSRAVLAGLGLLALSLPHSAWAQGAGGVLPANTVPVLRGVVSGAVVGPVVTTATGSKLTIEQSAQRAILDWRSFDIGSGSEVLFRQSGPGASALNRIYGNSPSVIQGKLSSTGPTVDGKASPGGQILLINQNGILFDRGSQVNVGALVASTLNISNARFLAGPLTQGALKTAAFEGGYDDKGETLATRPDGTRPGVIGIGTFGSAGAAAAQLTSDTSGSIILIAPRIDNQGGVISTPDGQVILAAGNKVYLAQNEDGNDITLRGLRVEVEAVKDGPALNLSNLIRNAGDISADRGNVTLAALAVNQEGRISAKTAVQSNGSIYLQARTKDNAQAGVATFSKGSITQVLPDAADKTTTSDSADYAPNRGVILVGAGTINSQGQITAAGGRIALNAVDTTNPESARVYLDAGSQTSVAGAWADVDLAKNLQTFRVTSNELKNSSDQKTGLLRGATVTVDLRQDSNILDLTGYRTIVPRTVTEKAGVGGELRIESTGAVIQREGASIDASGGGYRYGGGLVNTSRLLGDDGKIYDIATAPQLRQYTAQLDSFTRFDARWGQTQTYANPLGNVGSYQAGYVQGLGGGSVTITSKAGVVLDGQLRGGVTIGPNQLEQAPRGATLRVGERNNEQLIPESQRIGNITWQPQANNSLGADFKVNTALTEAQRDNLALGASQLFGSSTPTADGRVETGFGKVELNSNGRIVVPAKVSIAAVGGTELLMRGQQVDVAGDIQLPGGKLTLASAPLGDASILSDMGGAERVIVRTGAKLSTAGAWINTSNPDGSFVGAPTPTGRFSVDGSSVVAAVDGGSISIQVSDPLHQTRLERGASLDVGGGAALSIGQKLTAGKGGKLSIATGITGQLSPDWLQSDLRGFALANGAELNLNLARAVITNDGANGTLPSNTTRLQAGLFSSQGFSNVNLVASDGIDVTAGTQLQVSQKNWVLDLSAARALATGGSIATVASAQRLPDAQRNAASVSLNARGGALGASVLAVNKTASISTDARGNIALSAVDGLLMDGRLSAPGGQINVALNGRNDLNAADLRIGGTADISAAGVFLRNPSDTGQVQGTLLNGGSITVQAKAAGLLVESGAHIDVSAVNQVVDFSAGNTNNPPGPNKLTLEGQAGTLVFKSQGNTALNGSLMGRGGSDSAAGGSFAFEFTRPDGQATLPAERRIVVTRNSNSVPVEAGLVDATINVAALTAGGFEKLRLQSENRIEFRGSSALNFERGIRLDAPVIDLAAATNVQLQGASVALGQSAPQRTLSGNSGSVSTWELEPGSASPLIETRRGDGNLSVKAGAVDFFGNLTLNGSNLTRVESAGDVRFIGRPVTVAGAAGGVAQSKQVGSLTTAGDLEFKAAQLYTSTRSDFTVAVKDQPTGTLTNNGYVLIASNGQKAGDVYSAGSSLTVQAQSIVQSGTVKAPLGEVRLLAGNLLELTAGSVTSVSANGLVVPYGETQAGLSPRYKEEVAGPNGPSNLNAVSADGKRIEISAPKVDVRPGATVDLRGGGDVQALEFVPGNGGDTDITLRANTFAIIPTAQLSSLPYDTHTQAQKDLGFGFALNNGHDNTLYDSITLGAGAAVPAGQYALLPARYALLPNAYLVQLDNSSAFRKLQSGQTSTLVSGATVVAGFRSAFGTAVRESQSVGVVLSPGAAGVRRASDYNLSGAVLFADTAALDRQAPPRAPWDAGRLLIANASALTLDGKFETASAKAPALYAARAAEIDIASSRIAVVNQVGQRDVPADYLQIAGGALTGLNGSVLLGGKRSDTATGLRIDTIATNVLVANSETSAVRLPELLVAASGSIDVRAGSVLAAKANGLLNSEPPTVINTDGAGALLRLSGGAQARLARSNANDSTGDVRIAAGASLSADNALLIDATRSTESRGELRAGGAAGADGKPSGGSLSLSSVQVSLGDTQNLPSTQIGLILSNSDLAAYANLDELVLRAYGGLNLVGNTNLGSNTLKRLVIDSPVLRGQAAVVGTGPSSTTTAPRATLTARELEFSNNSVNAAANPSAVGAAPSAAAVLNLQAERLVLGAGNKAVAGFASTRIEASDTLALKDKGALNVAGAFTAATPRVLVQGGADQRLSAVDNKDPTAPVYGALNLVNSAAGANAAPLTRTELGGRVVLEGQSVQVATQVLARSGQITVAARGTQAADGVTLTSGAVLNASGQGKNFNGTVVAADGGSVSLVSNAGAIAVQSGALVDVSAAADKDGGGNAGQVVVQGSALQLAGQLQGRAAASARSGSADINLAGLDSFSTLNTALNSGGFNEERNVRARSGDINVLASDDVAARRVNLAADAGRLQVAGKVGTGAAAGGARIALYAQGDITLGAGSQIVANGSDAGARGGEVRVASGAGALVFDRAANIDVRAGEAGTAGSLIFGVARDSSHQMASTQLAGTVQRGGGTRLAAVDVEATRRYDINLANNVAGNVTAADISRFATDHSAFVQTANSASNVATVTGALRDENGALKGARMLGATEVRSAGDITLGSAWDLTSTQWLAAGNPGTLTVRAKNNLNIGQSIGVATDNIVAGDTWHMRLVAGADLAAANPLATRNAVAPNVNTGATPAVGNLALTNANAKLRTGTGRIELAAAGDVRIDNVAATIYTAGRIGAADVEANGNNRWAVDGGRIGITAGGNVAGAVSAAGDLWVSEWLRRPRLTQAAYLSAQATDWWAYRPRFQQGIGTLGGGDIDVKAAGNVSDLAAMLPTSGRTYRDAQGLRQVDVQGGGNLNLQAGGNLVGGAFLIGRGTGRVEAAGNVGEQRATQLYVMGVSSGAVPEQARVDLVAGGNVALQNISNPTALYLRAKDRTDPTTGPSFGTTGNGTYFYTYSSNSRADVVAKGGELTYAAKPAGNWRYFGVGDPISDLRISGEGSYPASLNLAALASDLSGPNLSNVITTFPSTTAHVAMLAAGSLNNVGFHASDRDPSTVITPTTRTDLANGNNALPAVKQLQASGTQLRITERAALPAGEFAFELQALTGNFVSNTQDSIYLPAASRIRAGVDLVGLTLSLQNLQASDVTQIRADTGDFRSPSAAEVRGPGRLLVQAGRNIDLGPANLGSPAGDLGGLVATGNNGNSQLPSEQSARLTLVAGVKGDVDLSKMDSAYKNIIALNTAASDVIDLYRQLGAETDSAKLLAAKDVASLAKTDAAYARFAALDSKAPGAFAAYQRALKTTTVADKLPLGAGAESTAAAALYKLLNTETDVAKLQGAGSLVALVKTPGGQVYQNYLGLIERYPRVFADYVQRRVKGALPTGVTPIVLSDALAQVVAQVVPASSLDTSVKGNINSFQTSIQTYGGSDVDLWAPNGNAVIGLTTPGARTIGVITNGGGAVRSVLSGDFNINQGKLITAQGGDIMLYTSSGSIDAGRGAKTSQATARPVRKPILDEDGNQIGVRIAIPPSATGSGIQSLTSDPDGLGPLTAPQAGNVYLFAPAGTVDAGEAGIKSSGNIVLNAGAVLNASNISSAGSSVGVPQLQTGSLASALASGGSNIAGSSKGAEEAARAASDAARKTAAAPVVKPTVLSVEVLGFGDKNCKEDDKDCFAK